MIAQLLALSIGTANLATEASPAMPTPAAPGPANTPAGAHPPEGAMHGLLAIFDMVCTRVFPDDGRLEALSTMPGARPLTPEEVREYLGTDPGRGWIATRGGASIVITIEALPVHACAVRMPRTDGEIDEALWRRIVDAAEARAGGGFAPVPARSIVVGKVRSSIVGDQKLDTDGSAEAFYLIRTIPTDAAAASLHGIELRLVRQIVAAGAR